VESIFEIIAEPNRRAILGLLVSSQQSVGEIERQLRMPQPTVSKHVRVLRDAGFVESTVDAQHRLYRLKPEPLQEIDAWLAPFRRFWSAHVDALERHLDRMDPSHANEKEAKEDKGKKMTDRERYTPGPASGAQIQKDGEKWTLILVRELHHPPARVWQALTDPAHLSEWAPFDADRNLAAAGPVKLSTVGTPTPQVAESTVKRAEAPRLSSIAGVATTLGGSLSRLAAARALRFGTTSIAASLQWVLPAGRSASTCLSGSLPVSRLDALWAVRP